MLKRILAVVLVLSILFAFPLEAVATENTSDSEYIILSEFTIPIYCSSEDTLQNSRLLEDGTRELGAYIQIKQHTGTNKIKTTIEVRTRNGWSSIKIKSFACNLKFVNMTEFSIPDITYNLSASVSQANATNYLSTENITSTAFIPGHTIAVTVKITDIQLYNATLEYTTPVSYTERITIR